MSKRTKVQEKTFDRDTGVTGVSEEEDIQEEIECKFDELFD
jgi:hypothetical protein